MFIDKKISMKQCNEQLLVLIKQEDVADKMRFIVMLVMEYLILSLIFMSEAVHFTAALLQFLHNYCDVT